MKGDEFPPVPLAFFRLAAKNAAGFPKTNEEIKRENNRVSAGSSSYESSLYDAEIPQRFILGGSQNRP